MTPRRALSVALEGIRIWRRHVESPLLQMPSTVSGWNGPAQFYRGVECLQVIPSMRWSKDFYSDVDEISKVQDAGSETVRKSLGRAVRSTYSVLCTTSGHQPSRPCSLRQGGQLHRMLAQ